MSADLLKAASAALVLLHSIQEKEEGACAMPWPEIDALELAVAEAAEEVKAAEHRKKALDSAHEQYILDRDAGGEND